MNKIYKQTLFLVILALVATTALLGMIDTSLYLGSDALQKSSVLGKIVYSVITGAFSSVVFGLLIWVSSKVERYKEGFENSKQILRMCLFVFPLYTIAASLIGLAVNNTVLPNSIGQTFMVLAPYIVVLAIGNYLSTARKAWFTGLPTPWTLSSDLSWAKTHRFLSRGVVGLALIALVLLMFSVDPSKVYIAFLWSLLAVNVAAIVYSYIVWKGDPHRTQKTALTT